MIALEQLNETFASLTVAGSRPIDENQESNEKKSLFTLNSSSSTAVSTKTPFSAHHNNGENAMEMALETAKDNSKNESNVISLTAGGAILNDNDVLLLVSKNNRVVGKLVPGTAFYWRQISQHRSKYRFSAKNGERRSQIVQSVAKSVWQAGGRFLAYDDKSRSLSTMQHDSDVFRRIAKDLSSRPPQRRFKSGGKKNQKPGIKQTKGATKQQISKRNHYKKKRSTGQKSGPAK